MDREGRRRRLLLSRRLRHRPCDAVHRALPRNGARVRLHSIRLDDPADVPDNRGRNVVALLFAFSPTSLAATSPEARTLDGACETTDGFPPLCDVALSSRRP